MRKAQAARLATVIAVLLFFWVYDMVAKPPVTTLIPCDRDCYVNRKMAEREALARDRYLADLESTR